ncbi:glycoside hydrolase family 3 protein [Auricularia subglabra TFB-10046 SS5]|uniref:beta-glucosidase n=1 Tax=Auricularia subglabra (strain TFB-10046 / SS5) TaxID=717982 RepID=J0WV06_AURST|nr:glycoside hydrolase family 3 protein [Auricularia subglabra TFB-10046 SS5]
MTAAEFAKADIDAIVEKLTIEESTALITGVGWWHTAAIPRLGVPAIKVSDGPNGVRGQHFFNGSPAKCIPCATALGATWDPELVRELGARILAPEAKLRTASVLLAPTVNIQRSPLGGRSFESFAEDPVLSGTLASAYINGVQSEGVACTIKHLVCNDQENARMGSNSIVSPRALREVYLLPFQIAQRDAKPWAIMTSYNLVNGTHASENRELIEGILRGEWGFDGLVMSDWYGVYSLDQSIKAGVDLEMPGVRNWRTPNLIERGLVSHKLTVDDLKARARKVLETVQRASKHIPEVVDRSVGAEDPPTEFAEDVALLRRAAAASIVLLRNEGGVLPLDKSKLKRVAIIGPNAKTRTIYGGGSAQIRSLYAVSPYEGIVRALGNDVQVSYVEGVRSFKSLASLDYELVNPDGKRGWRMEYYNHSAEHPEKALDTPVRVFDVTETSIRLNDHKLDFLTPQWSLKLRGSLTPRDADGEFEFGLTVSGRAKLFVDGQLVVDNWTKQRKGPHFFGRGTEEECGKIAVRKGVQYDILVEYSNISGPTETDSSTGAVFIPCVRLSGAPVVDADEQLRAAEEAAKAADVAIVVVGLNAEWESETFDRTTLALPARTDELVHRVAKANARTVVVNQSGSAVDMPWVTEVPGVLQAWYLGNSAGDGIADVLFGEVNPSAKMSLTFPRRLQDVPSYLHFGGKEGPVHYSEDLFVGYKHYVDREIAPLFPFGFGLSYTSFEYSGLKLSQTTLAATNAADLALAVTISISNTGSRAGTEIVQVYVSPPPHPLGEPLPSRVLRGFARAADLKPGESRNVTVALDKYAFSSWDEERKAWVVRKGTFGISVAASSVDIKFTATVDVSKTLYWNGV